MEFVSDAGRGSRLQKNHITEDRVLVFLAIGSLQRGRLETRIRSLVNAAGLVERSIAWRRQSQNLSNRRASSWVSCFEDNHRPLPLPPLFTRERGPPSVATFLTICLLQGEGLFDRVCYLIQFFIFVKKTLSFLLFIPGSSWEGYSWHGNFEMWRLRIGRNGIQTHI